MRGLLTLVMVAAISSPAAGEEGVHERWTRPGLGFVAGIGLSDLDGDGSNEILLGGRGVGAVDQRSLQTGRFRWANKWPDIDNLLRAGDNDFVLDMETADITADGVRDAIVGTSEALFAIDGENGDVLWKVKHETGWGSSDEWDIAVADLNGDGVPDVASTSQIHEVIRAVDGKDGAPLWEYERSGWIGQMGAADIEDDGTAEIIAVGGTDGIPLHVHVIGTTEMPVTGERIANWARPFPGGDPTVFTVGETLPGGTRQVVVGGFGGEIAIYEARTGLPLRAWTAEAEVTDVVLANVDTDAEREVIAATATGVEAFDATGLRVWELATSARVLDLELVPNGDVAVGGQGFALAIDTAGVTTTPPAVRWSMSVPEDVRIVRAGEAFGVPTILLGADGHGGLRGVAHDGALLWSFRTGAFVRRVAGHDLDRDGAEEVIEAGDDGTVAIHGVDGSMQGSFGLPTKATPTTVDAGDLSPQNGHELVVGTHELGLGGPGGEVQAYSRNGEELWRSPTVGPLGDVRVVDLDGDGQNEVIAGSGGPGIDGQGARVARLDRHGSIEWARSMPPSLTMVVDTGDLTGDGISDVAAGTNPLLGDAWVVLMDGASGEERWRFRTDMAIQWVSVNETLGVGVGDFLGNVYRLDGATGTPVWELQLPAQSWHGGWTIDADADGVRDVVTACQDGSVSMLSGATGAEIWRAPLSPDDGGFRIASLRTRDGVMFGVGTYAYNNGQRNGIYVLRAADGHRIDRVGAEYHVFDVGSGDLDGDGDDELLAAAGWQIHALDV